MTMQTITKTPIDEGRFFEVISPGPQTTEQVASALGAERDLVQERMDQYTLLECLVFDAETGRYWNSCPWPRADQATS